jgi:hypothetical protein
MSRASSRLHTTGGILFILDAIGHSIGQFTPGPPDPVGKGLERTMRGFVISGTSFTYWNVMQCWGALYGAMTLLLGVLLLASVRAAPGDARVRRTTAIVGAIAASVQAVVAIAYRTPPPAFFMVPAAVCFALAAGLSERKTP